MPLTEEQSLLVRQQIADVLGVDVARVTKYATLMPDFGADNDKLKRMQSAIEQSLGVAIDPIVMDINALTQVDGDGNLTIESLSLLRTYLSDLHLPFEPVPFAQVFTAGMVEVMAEKAWNERARPEAAAIRALSPEQSARIRTWLAFRSPLSVEQLRPETNLTRDLEISGVGLRLLCLKIEKEFDVDLSGVFEKIAARFRVDDDGNLTLQSRKHLEPLLSGIDYEAAGPRTSDDVITVGLIESLVARSLALRPTDLPLQPIGGHLHENWIRRLSEELGDRKLRLLLAGVCRLAYRDQRKVEPEILIALETLERFADTGKTKRALRDLQKGYWEWREGRQQPEFGLYHALTPDDPTQVLVPVTYALCGRLRLSGVEATRELFRLHRDLCSPLSTSEEFLAAWRTPAVVSLARSMYEGRRFDAMPRLADLLLQAGCDHATVLAHCRDSQAVHIRGCWVIDAVLDGAWAEEPKAAKPKRTKPKVAAADTPHAKSSPLAQLPKRTQIDIAKIMAAESSQVPVETFLSRYFHATREESIRAMTSFDADRAAADIDDESFDEELRRPELSLEQLHLKYATRMLDWRVDTAVARRITLSDPAELARGLFVANRLEWLRSDEVDQDCDFLLNLFAVRDRRAVDALARLPGYTDPDFPNDEHTLCSELVSALIRQDVAAVPAVAERMRRKKAPTWMKHKFECLLGIAERQGDGFVHGLHGMLESYPKRRDESADSLLAAFNVEAHGLYRLAEEFAPEVVAGFDIARPFPWDAEFHVWTQAQEHPLDGIDLKAVSPLLRDVLVDLKIPDWWALSPEAARRREEELESRCDVWLLDGGPKPEDVRTIVASFCPKPPSVYPAQVFSGAMRYMAEGWKKQLTKLGATVELRPSPV